MATMRPTLLIGALLVAAPATAQDARVYTNADLVNGPVRWTRTVTQDELRSLEANQFRLPAPLPNGPEIVGVLSSPTAGPFGEFPRYESLQGDGGLGYWPLNPYLSPIGAVGFGGVGFHRGASRFRDRPSHVAPPQAHTPTPARALAVPPRTVITTPASAGIRRPAPGIR
jgi:hypothetical protein